DLRLDADRDRRHRRPRRVGARVHQGSLGLPAARQPADALRRLLPRADRGDHDPRAAAAADRGAARRRPDPLRARHGAQPMIGLLHPPMGMVLFVLARVSGLSFERTTIAILPWLVPLLVSLVVITYLPRLVLWLPKMFF